MDRRRCYSARARYCTPIDPVRRGRTRSAEHRPLHWDPGSGQAALGASHWWFGSTIERPATSQWWCRRPQRSGVNSVHDALRDAQRQGRNCEGWIHAERLTDERAVRDVEAIVAVYLPQVVCDTFASRGAERTSAKWMERSQGQRILVHVWGMVVAAECGGLGKGLDRLPNACYRVVGAERLPVRAVQAELPVVIHGQLTAGRIAADSGNSQDVLCGQHLGAKRGVVHVRRVKDPLDGIVDVVPEG